MKTKHIVISSLVASCLIINTALANRVLPPQPNVNYTVTFDNATLSNINSHYAGDGCAAGEPSVAPGQTKSAAVNCAFRASGGQFTLTDQSGNQIGTVKADSTGCGKVSALPPYQINLSPGHGRGCHVTVIGN